MSESIQILLVDDNPYFLEAAREFLLIQGDLPLASVAADADEAICKALQLKPDIILLDLNLAGRSGLELIPAFKKMLPGSHVVVMTIMEGEQYRTAALQAGADAFILKNEMDTTLVPVISKFRQQPGHAHAEIGYAMARSQLEDQLGHLLAQPESTRDAIVAADAGYTMTVWNMAAEAMYGWKAEEVLGRNALEIMQTEFAEGDRLKMLKFITRTGGYRGDVTQVRKDGTRFPVRVSSIVLRDEQGQLIGYASLNRDLSLSQSAGQTMLE